MKITTDIMKDASEIVHYDTIGIPIYIKKNSLSNYPDKRALCHWHEDIEFIRILDGKMNYHINGKKVLLKKEDCIIINARQMHYGYSYNQQDCKFICILIHPRLLLGNTILYSNYILPILENQNLEYLCFSTDDRKKININAVLDRIYEIKLQQQPAYEMEIISLISLLWSRLVRYFKLIPLDSPNKTHSDLIIQKDMVSFIYQHYSDKITLSDIASSGNVCRNKCCTIFKQYLQQSPIDFLNAYRLEVSCNLLKNTSVTISEIALACGFNHLSYYSKLFFQKYECTPSKYHKLHYIVV